MQHSSEAGPRPSDAVAYLVVRDGNTWRDVFRLIPGQVTTVGRAPTNRIVLRDEICSRNHCEIFQSGHKWTLRDLGSRNGTLINGVQVAGDSELNAGDVIQIGGCDLGFTFDLSKPFPNFADRNGLESDTLAVAESAENDEASEAAPEILHRQRNSRFQSPHTPEVLARDRTSQELARLYRLALEMGTARDSRGLADIVLKGLFDGSGADIGAILLLERGTSGHADPDDLRVVSYSCKHEQPYQKVSKYLSSVVLADREAILARDVADDSRLASRDSLGLIQAKSVICTPIRTGTIIHGLVHLYSTNLDNPLDRDDLEFTLAVADQLALSLDNLKEREVLQVGLARVQDENMTLRRQLEIESEIVGDSPEIQHLRQSIARVAPTGATALIRGESGVGKELVARAIHFSSDRRNQPFVCMNCAALSESLLESELFGHEKGSFTGAVSRNIGKFEQAHRGTLFLDEVGEMNLSVQAKFLRVLEGHPYERVGGGTPVKVDVRVVAATNRDLEQAVKQNAFRRDLYFRLHVFQLFVKPLREHCSDVPQLADHFLTRIARKMNRPVKRFSRGALDLLVNYDWPGNIRELQNTVERAVILCSGEVVTEDDIQLSRLGGGSNPGLQEPQSGEYREVSLEVLEQEHILATLDRTNWNKSRSAQILGIERSTLDRKLKRYHVSRPKES